ncbi:hypothetical protein B566_EDAN005322 [Ephemera danica]|nr:hypothetical protein B566_EDAN005322 [Ephemera danica]
MVNINARSRGRGPDISLSDLRALLRSKEDGLFPNFYSCFMEMLEDIVNLDIEGVLGLIDKCKKLMEEPSLLMPVITKTSVLGLYIRRNAVLFDKLSCSGVVKVFKAFKVYYNSSPKLEKENHPVRHIKFSSPVPPDDDDVMMQTSEEPHEVIITAAKESNVDCSGTWTRKQAELFLAQQSSCIVKNEATALDVQVLHNKIQDLLYAIPDCSEAYFVAYLNFLRVKDFCGALHSLYHCFDCGAGFNVDPKMNACIPGNTEDKTRSFRYGALNLAMFYAAFGHKKEALFALKECITLARGSSCNFCLQHALSWLYRLTNEGKVNLIERNIARTTDLGLHYLTSLSIQSLVQYSSFSKRSPASLYESMTKSDILNCQHSMLDLAANSYALKSTLWSLYGRPAMASLYSQLLLQSEVQDNNSEATCLALCQLATKLYTEGEPSVSAALIYHAEERYPQLSTKSLWTFCNAVLSFEHNIRQGHWQDARKIAEEMAAVNKWESIIRLAELNLMQGDRHEAMDNVTDVLTHCASVEEGSPSLHVRALIMQARILGTRSTHGARILVSALSYAESHHFTNLSNTITLKIAEHQLSVCLAAQAMSLLSNILLSIMSHGSVFEQGEALLLQAKCRVAMVDCKVENCWSKVFPLTIETLNTAKAKFEKCQAVSKVREVILFQGLLYHTFGCKEDKYKVSLELRHLEEQIASRTSSHV